MKIVITESQLKYIVEQEDVCLQDELMELNDFLGGVVEINSDDIGGDMTDEELMIGIQDPKVKNVLSKILSNLSRMTPEQLREELKKVMSLKNLKEQQTPYMDRTTTIGGVTVPTVAIHGVLGLIAISILTKLIKAMGNIQGSRGNRRRRLSSRAVGCQGGAARAKLQRQRRRRESWRRFLVKVGLR
jgi:hypothetical protein